MNTVQDEFDITLDDCSMVGKKVPDEDFFLICVNNDMLDHNLQDVVVREIKRYPSFKSLYYFKILP